MWDSYNALKSERWDSNFEFCLFLTRCVALVKVLDLSDFLCLGGNAIQSGKYLGSTIGCTSHAGDKRFDQYALAPKGQLGESHRSPAGGCRILRAQSEGWKASHQSTRTPAPGTTRQRTHVALSSPSGETGRSPAVGGPKQPKKPTQTTHGEPRQEPWPNLEKPRLDPSPLNHSTFPFEWKKGEKGPERGNLASKQQGSVTCALPFGGRGGRPRKSFPGEGEKWEGRQARALGFSLPLAPVGH